jgi:superfamily II DNA or RNA helicase
MGDGETIQQPVKAPARLTLADIERSFEPVPDNPLVTPYTRFMGVPDKKLAKLWAIRQHDPADGPIKLNLGNALRDGVHLRNYQTQMVAHLMMVPRMIVGDAVGLGKTLSAIAGMGYLVQKNPDTKFIVMTTRSTTYQWRNEIVRFSGILKPYVLKDKYKDSKSSAARLSQITDFLRGSAKNVLVCKYTSLVGKRRKVEGEFDENGDRVWGGREKTSPEILALDKILAEHKGPIVLVLDEAHKFKTTTSQIRSLVVHMSRRAERVWAMTATAIKNSLDEFYSIASAIGIRPFGVMSAFRDDFCVYRSTHVGRGIYKNTLVGYKNVKNFKTGIRPWFYGRSQAQVKEPLPRLTTVFHQIDLDDVQLKLLLDDIPNGDFALPPTVRKVAGEIEIVERDPDNMMAQPLDSKILTPTGWKLMGDMVVGDAIIDPDGGTAYVEGISTQRIQPTYAVTTNNGAVVECSKDHLWLVQKYSRRATACSDGWEVLPLSELLAQGVTYSRPSGGVSYRFSLPPIAPVTYKAQPTPPIPPYTLGVLLGDGSLTSTIEFASVDAEVVERIRGELLPGTTLVSYNRSGGIYHNLSSGYSKGSPRTTKRNPYITAAKELGIFGVTASSKRVPPSYLLGSPEDRLALLRGLMDSGGCAFSRLATFGSTSKGLCLDVVDLVRSLGGLAKIRSRKASGAGNLPVWVVDIKMTESPFHLTRKTLKWAPSTTHNTIVSIDYVGEKVCQCLRVTSSRRLYVTDGFTPTHNTMLSVMQLISNHQCLLDPLDLKKFHTPSLSPKEEALLDLLDGELKGEHVICYTKYRSWINRLQWLHENGKFSERRFLRITGAENEKQRESARLKFQDPESGYDCIYINAAAIEGVNLQQAAHMICLDSPWSWGDMQQLVGRMVRMASPHTACTLHIIVARGTIDEYAIETLRSKKGVFEIILGESFSQGILDGGQEVDLTSGLDDLTQDHADFQHMLKAHAKPLQLKKFVFGEVLEGTASGKRKHTLIDKEAVFSNRSERVSLDRLEAEWGIESI